MFDLENIEHVRNELKFRGTSIKFTSQGYINSLGEIKNMNLLEQYLTIVFIRCSGNYWYSGILYGNLW